MRAWLRRAVSPLYGPPPGGVEMAWRPGAADFLAALAGLGYRPLDGGPPADRADPAGGTPGSAARAGRPSRAARAARRASTGGAETGPAVAPQTPAAVADVLAALQRVCRALVAVVRHGVRRRAANPGALGAQGPRLALLLCAGGALLCAGARALRSAACHSSRERRPQRRAGGAPAARKPVCPVQLGLE